MRLFISINFDDTFKAKLIETQELIKKSCASVRGSYSAAENLHLTLAFIGESTQRKRISEAIDEAAASLRAFPISSGRLGHFGDLWYVGISDGADSLTEAAERVRAALSCRGVDYDTKPFRPHITLVRRLETDGVPQFDLPRADTTASKISLMRSDRGADGRIRYTEIYSREF